ncbi:hypothetical protein N7510_007101 [Penicillium lagena]|uniref:uncharacterized protein n=1 Tax=Penicillium lagena TaxID=94218 RepID=UPI0025410C61|nr:uncharacterized protein N7510_007101 [Penicillium lagena]KAJ5610382.1 hypothetical protein N7510_007101 [Penicillium lagena]
MASPRSHARTCNTSAFASSSGFCLSTLNSLSLSESLRPEIDMESTTPSSNSFRSRRSYPSLHQVSVAPLTPRFPIDDDPEPTDYFSTRDTTNENAPIESLVSPRTSYLTSASVPGTPSLLSHSRSASRSRHARSKSSTRPGHLSDTNLHANEIRHALHHHQSASHSNSTGKRPSSAAYSKRQFNSAGHGAAPANAASDAEWMLRAGIALASSTREQKGQSWLSKRESSTSLVSEMPFDESHAAATRHHHRTKSGASSRKSRSGASTPGGALSRRSSRSRGGSRRSSRAGLAMTAIPPPLSSVPSSTAGQIPGPGPVGETASPEETRGSGPALVADFVDERIRAEMAALQHRRERGISDDDSEFHLEGNGEGEGDYDSDSQYDYSSSSTPDDDFDEADLQRLTRERGFGLGTWLDRLVEWTLFSTDEWTGASAPGTTQARIGTAPTSTTVTFEEPVTIPHVETDDHDRHHDNLSLASSAEYEYDDSEDGDDLGDGDVLSHTDGDESTAKVEKPGANGGWEDAGWLLRMVKRAIL